MKPCKTTRQTSILITITKDDEMKPPTRLPLYKWPAWIALSAVWIIAETFNRITKRD